MIRELYRMLSFWRRHHRCEGFRDVNALGMYMLWCQAHQVGETTGHDKKLMENCPVAAKLGPDTCICAAARSSMQMGQPAGRHGKPWALSQPVDRRGSHRRPEQSQS